jgi:hypothetical protein
MKRHACNPFLTPEYSPFLVTETAATGIGILKAKPIFGLI